MVLTLLITFQASESKFQLWWVIYAHWANVKPLNCGLKSPCLNTSPVATKMVSFEKASIKHGLLDYIHVPVCTGSQWRQKVKVVQLCATFYSSNQLWNKTSLQWYICFQVWSNNCSNEEIRHAEVWILCRRNNKYLMAVFPGHGQNH